MKHFMIHIERPRDGREFCYGVYAETAKEARGMAHQMYLRRDANGEYGKIKTIEER